MEKTLRYLLIVAAVVSFLSVSAQGLSKEDLTQLPEIEMRSTSTMVGSGSTLPSAAVQGVTTADQQSPGQMHAPKGPRKGLGGGGGSGEPGDRPEPYEDPIGDAMWPMMVLALVYGVWCRVYRRKRV